jgi:enoyl-[acyl-carrier protein] reductase II
MRDCFHTSLCDLLGIEYPVLQSGMGSVAGPELAAEVSRAGGLGIVAGLEDPEHFPMYSGQGVGLIHDLPGAAEVVEAIVREARAVLAGLPGRAGLG